MLADQTFVIDQSDLNRTGIDLKLIFDHLMQLFELLQR